ncbi:plastocyanin/azurin family copper-binding protein [Halopelagius fulvigenes]|uniref:Plastocyanin/azurin family copper-binding protein n=1 Tax=Halopelagius fulvigenes TaxID=1198324 RepID=A0ABD5TZK5_9EURY
MPPESDEHGSTGGERNSSSRRQIPRRTVLRVAGASTALSLGAGAATATGDDGCGDGDGDGSEGSDGPAAPRRPKDIDPVFGYASAAESPCLGEASEDCFEAFGKSVRPSHEVEMYTDLPEPLLAVGGRGSLSDSTLRNVNEAAADGSVDEGELSNPNSEVTVQLPDGSSKSVTVREIAALLAETMGFHFEPAGLRVSPGDVVLYSAEAPDHGVTAYHERHGRQHRVPDGAEPVSSPIVPVGGYWLYRFEEEGVYDFYCPPHEPFGMVHRVVVTDEEGDAPELSIEQTGRPPQDTNNLASVLGGLDPNLPSALAALESDALNPERIVEEGTVSWEAVVEAYRTG